MHSRPFWIWRPSWIFRVVEKAGSNGRISVGFYICTIGPQIDILKLKRLCYNFCPNSFVYWTNSMTRSVVAVIRAVALRIILSKAVFSCFHVSFTL